MQQRVNRWLSPELLAAAQPTPAPEPGFEQTLAPTTPSTPSWQRLAALVLLLGSAAFSYVAWSDVGAGKQLLSRSADGAVTPTTSTELKRVEQVHRLREENQRLHVRLQELQQDLASLRQSDHAP